MGLVVDPGPFICRPNEHPMRKPILFLLALAVTQLLPGCTRWEAYALPTTLTPNLPSYLRISAPGRMSTVLVDPFVRRDTLFGRSHADTLAIALPAIERLERPRLDRLRTAAALVGGVAGWIALAFVGGGWE
jgi:hypothetical protein